MRGANNSVDTVNAAAAAIANAERRVQQVTHQRRKWGGCLSAYWCFGDTRNIRRISHASFSPETTLPHPAYVTLAPEITIHASALSLPFIAPPSSPTSSTLHSEPPSATRTIETLFSLNSVEACSSHRTSSMFTIGPYAYDTQLVSPPVFSAFTTEPSTAPRTPPEPVHFHTPALPEVPFSQLLLSSLDSNLKRGHGCRSYLYQHHSGSPSAYIISPSCGCSGTSSPLPDFESHSSSSVASHNVTCQVSRLNSMKIGESHSSSSVASHNITCQVSRLNSMKIGDRTNGNEHIQTWQSKSHKCFPIVDLRMPFDSVTEEVTQPVIDGKEFKARALPDPTNGASDLTRDSGDDCPSISSTVEQSVFAQESDQASQPMKDEDEVGAGEILELREDISELIENLKRNSQHGNVI